MKEGEEARKKSLMKMRDLIKILFRFRGYIPETSY